MTCSSPFLVAPPTAGGDANESRRGVQAVRGWALPRAGSKGAGVRNSTPGRGARSRERRPTPPSEASLKTETKANGAMLYAERRIGSMESRYYASPAHKRHTATSCPRRCASPRNQAIFSKTGRRTCREQLATVALPLALSNAQTRSATAGKLSRYNHSGCPLGCVRRASRETRAACAHLAFAC